MTDDSTFVLQLRVRSAQQMNHAFAAGVVLVTILPEIAKHREFHASTIAGAAIAALLIALIVRERRRPAGAHHQREGFHVDWLELVTALFLAFEAWEKTHASRHHMLFVVLSYLPPVIILFLALFGWKLPKRFFLRVDDAGIRARTSLFQRVNVAWAELAAFSPADRGVRLHYADGGNRKIGLWRAENREAAQAWLVARLAAHLPETVGKP